MSGPGVGFEYPPQEVSWLKRDVLLFANTVGCTDQELHFLYVNTSLHFLPSTIGLGTDAFLGAQPWVPSLPYIPYRPS